MNEAADWRRQWRRLNGTCRDAELDSAAGWAASAGSTEPQNDVIVRLPRTVTTSAVNAAATSSKMRQLRAVCRYLTSDMDVRWILAWVELVWVGLDWVGSGRFGLG